MAEENTVLYDKSGQLWRSKSCMVELAKGASHEKPPPLFIIVYNPQAGLCKLPAELVARMGCPVLWQYGLYSRTFCPQPLDCH